MNKIKEHNTKIFTSTFKTLKYIFSIPLLVVFFILAALNVEAQTELLNQDTASKEKAEVVYPPDSLGRRNPRGTVEGFIRAAATNNYKTAAQYLTSDPKLKKGKDTGQLAIALQVLLDKNGNIYPYSWISDEPAGLQDDNLGPDLDRIGVATVKGESFDLLLERSMDKQGAPIWLFSAETLKRVPLDSISVVNTTIVEKVSPGFLEKHEWGGVPVAHWLAMVLLVIVAYIIAIFITRFLVYLIPLVWRKARTESTAGIINSFVLPIRLYLAVLLFVIGSREAGISIIVRQRLTDVTLIVGVVAFLLLLWQLLDTTVINQVFQRFFSYAERQRLH
jgi:MscS family membrane protein